jgi:hypothetical protein
LVLSKFFDADTSISNAGHKAIVKISPCTATECSEFVITIKAKMLTRKFLWKDGLVKGLKYLLLMLGRADLTRSSFWSSTILWMGTFLMFMFTNFVINRIRTTLVCPLEVLINSF